MSSDAEVTSRTPGAPESEGKQEKGRVIQLNVPQRYLALPGVGGLTGLSIGLIRGARDASLRFLAENAHRAPTTVQGWYLYKKTKNYRMMLGGLKAGGWEGAKLGSVGLCWAGLEDGMERAGLGSVREVGAGLGTAGLFAGLNRLGWRTGRRTVGLGLLIGGVMTGLRWGRDWVEDEQLRREASAVAGL